MNNLTKEEKLRFIIEKQEKFRFSAHLISKNTGISNAGVQRILDGTSKSPQEKSLNLIMEFFERKESGTNLNVKESLKPAADYIDIPKIHELQQEIISLYRELKELRSNLSECQKSKK
jgi:DNA-binding transcriptional MerR regulator